MTAGSRTSQLTAVLDANVLYPAPLRDFFMWLAANNLFEPLKDRYGPTQPGSGLGEPVAVDRVM